MSYVVLSKDYSYTCDRCNEPICRNEEMQIKHYPYKKYGRDDYRFRKNEVRHYCWRCKDEE